MNSYSWKVQVCSFADSEYNIAPTTSSVEVPHKYHTSTALVPQNYHTNTTQVPHKHQTSTTQVPHKYHTNTTQIPHKYHTNTTQTSNKYLTSTSQVPHKYQNTPQVLLTALPALIGALGVFFIKESPRYLYITGMDTCKHHTGPRKHHT